MYQLDGKQIGLVSGGEAVFVTDEWKQELYYKAILTDSLGLGFIGCVGYLTEYGLAISSLLNGFAIGALAGGLYGLYSAYSINQMFETGNWYNL